MTDQTANLPANRQERRNELAEVKFSGGQMFQPTNARELMDMANLMSSAGPMVKPFYRNSPGACMALISVCAPYGLNPLQVSWHTYQASKGDDAPISYEAKVIVAMLNASGTLKGSLQYELRGERGKDRSALVTGTLRDGTVLTYETPPVSAISPKNSPLWKTDEDQQLCYYGGRAWTRRHRPEMLLGVYDVDEELPAIGPDAARDITPRPGGAVYADQKSDPFPPTPDDAITEDGEIIEDPRKEQARAKAREGRQAFVTWWQTLTPEQRAPILPMMTELERLANEADAAVKHTESREGEAVPHTPDEHSLGGAAKGSEARSNGQPAASPPIDYDKVVALIRRDIAEILPEAMNQLRETYAAELDAIQAARPDAHAELMAAIAEREKAA